MGEHADIEIDRQMRQMFGIGYEKPASKLQKQKPTCSCGRKFRFKANRAQHMKDTGHDVPTSERTTKDTTHADK